MMDERSEMLCSSSASLDCEEEGADSLEDAEASRMRLGRRECAGGCSGARGAMKWMIGSSYVTCSKTWPASEHKESVDSLVEGTPE